jgi:hypothetical protein
MNPYGSYTSGSGYGVNLKQEEDLAMAIKKALTPEESAPKQKHVRACILYSWDAKGNHHLLRLNLLIVGSGSLLNALKTFPMLGSDVIQFKALILYHKCIRQGHPNLLADAYNDTAWLDQVDRNTQYSSGYNELIAQYVSFLRRKLRYHKDHTYFSGTFDYEEYVTLRGIEDPNEGYETITELIDLLDLIDSFQKRIFANLRSYGDNQARIAALVPLVEESDGIYKFINSMMYAMHRIIGSKRLTQVRLKYWVLYVIAAKKFTIKC